MRKKFSRFRSSQRQHERLSKRVDLSNQRHHEIASACTGTAYDISIKRIYHTLVLEKQKKEGRVLLEYEKKVLYHKARDIAFYE